jgi:Protein of unknown function (DUF2735)
MTTMINNSNRHSAKIYEFPLQRRVRTFDLREVNASANESRPLDAIESVSGSWYHEAAIREERARQR